MTTAMAPIAPARSVCQGRRRRTAVSVLLRVRAGNEEPGRPRLEAGPLVPLGFERAIPSPQGKCCHIIGCPLMLRGRQKRRHTLSAGSQSSHTRPLHCDRPPHRTGHGRPRGLRRTRVEGTTPPCKWQISARSTTPVLTAAAVVSCAQAGQTTTVQLAAARADTQIQAAMRNLTPSRADRFHPLAVACRNGSSAPTRPPASSNEALRRVGGMERFRGLR